ncbi:MAG TPA: Hpt domain-containing protein, partial [Spirochaetia bacterium]|nr:Hpt domain-containing protein [Spirochaetia bacterium]
VLSTVSVTDGEQWSASSGGQDRSEDLYGFDVQDGIRRFSGNRDVWKSCVKEFLSTCAQRLEKVHNALDRGDRGEARQLVHVLRGVAGNLSAARVFAAARDLEEGIANAANPLETYSGLLHELQRELDLMVQSAKANGLFADDEEKAREPISRDGLRSELARLSAEVDDRSTEALRIAERLISMRHPAETATLLKEIAEALRAYDFDAANPLISSLRKGLD